MLAGHASARAPSILIPKVRTAELRDVRTLAELMDIASDGVSRYVWSRLTEPGESLLDTGARRFARKGVSLSYENAVVVELDAVPAAMLVAFPLQLDPAGDDEEDPVLKPYAALEEDNSYYICALAVFEAFRGQGLGSRLLTIAEEQARARGFKKTSLIVFEQNFVAALLYKRRGYREVARTPIVPHPLIKARGDALLMVKDLD